MSLLRRKRWTEVLRRTSDKPAEPDASGVLNDATLWEHQQRAFRGASQAETIAEQVAAAVARERALTESAIDRAGLVAGRSQSAQVGAQRVGEALERLGVVALNAGLEGARVAEREGRALLLVADEIRENVVKGTEALRDVGRQLDEIVASAAEVRRLVENLRGELGEVGQNTAQLKNHVHDAVRGLDDLGRDLRKATGFDPEVARAATAAAEHARGLLSALSILSGAQSQAVFAALRPALLPILSRFGDDPGPSEGKNT